MPQLGAGAETWVAGTWTSQLLDVSKQEHPTTTDNVWSELRWKEDNTSDETEAYVRVTILSSSDAVLQSELKGVSSNKEVGYKTLNLNKYSNVKSVDIKVKFILRGKTVSPIVSEPKVR